MRVIKKFAAVFFAALTIVTAVPTGNNPTVITVEAHSGRTDANGGHRDNKNVSGLGSYHYHCGGYEAHLHVNGVCPYATVSTSAGATKTGTQSATESSATDVSSAAAKSISVAVQGTKQTIVISDTSYDNVAFNASYYANAYTDLYEAYGDDAKALYDHFIKTGIKEGRQSSAQFCITAYKDNNQDLVEAFGDDLLKYYNHYIEYGVKEKRVSK